MYWRGFKAWWEKATSTNEVVPIHRHEEESVEIGAAGFHAGIERAAAFLESESAQMLLDARSLEGDSRARLMETASAYLRAARDIRDTFAQDDDDE